ncbi:MAG: serine/threonine protein kinase [Planctomycetota bacterium]|nr:MAG: serine/threonine protein kinase [Planctomycetota bacterium]
MLGLEDLFVASQAVRQSLVAPEPLRRALAQLDAHPERVQLVRYLHERAGIPMEQALAMHYASLNFLRRRSEDRYATILRQRAEVPAHVVEGLAMEQAQAGYSWGLGERLVQEGVLRPEQHRALQEETIRALRQEEERILGENRSTAYAQVLGPPVSPPRAPAEPPQPQATGTPPSRRTAVHVVHVPPAPAAAGPPGASAEASSGGEGLDAAQLAADPAATLPWSPEDGEPTEDATATLLEGPAAAPKAPRPADAAGATLRMRVDEVLPLPATEAGVGAGGPSPAAPLPPDADPFATMTFKPGETMAGGLRASLPEVRMGGERPVLRPGESVGGKYQVEGEIGRGAMGIVYEGYDPEAGAPVAIKVVQGPATEEVRGRFQREILVSQRATHEHVIRVFDAGELGDGSSYMVMELLEGESLQALLAREGALSCERSLALFEQLLRGLAALHAKQIVHRDLKPENLHVERRGGAEHLKIVDFGISRFLDEGAVEEKLFVTMRGQLSGTPQYVAPEAILDPEEVRPSHDVYACGVILFEMLTGALPFPKARTLRDLLADTVHARPRALDEANPARGPYPEPIQRLVRRLLEKDPEARPADGAAALSFLQEVQDELAGRRPPPTDGGAAPASATARFFRRITGLFRRRKAGGD